MEALEPRTVVGVLHVISECIGVDEGCCTASAAECSGMLHCCCLMLLPSGFLFSVDVLLTTRILNDWTLPWQRFRSRCLYECELEDWKTVFVVRHSCQQTFTQQPFSYFTALPRGGSPWPFNASPSVVPGILPSTRATSRRTSTIVRVLDGATDASAPSRLSQT
jgi:hypothetical protein